MSQSGIPPPSAALFGGAKKSIAKSAAAPWVLAVGALVLGVLMIRAGGSESEKGRASMDKASDSVTGRAQREADSAVSHGVGTLNQALTARPK